jgi:acyl carrier protein
VSDSDNPKQRITAMVRALLAKHGIDALPSVNDDLAASGLSSLDMVNLMLAVEGAFGVKIPDRDLTPGNFATIARIGSLVDGLTETA